MLNENEAYAEDNFLNVAEETVRTRRLIWVEERDTEGERLLKHKRGTRINIRL